MALASLLLAHHVGPLKTPGGSVAVAFDTGGKVVRLVQMALQHRVRRASTAWRVGSDAIRVRFAAVA